MPLPCLLISKSGIEKKPKKKKKKNFFYMGKDGRDFSAEGVVNKFSVSVL
jgi:hypothetical protein